MIRRAIRDLISVQDSTEEIGEDEINQLIFLGESSEPEANRICEINKKKDSEKPPILIEPFSKNEQIFVENAIQKLSQTSNFFNFSPKTVIKDLLDKKDKNSLIYCYENGENIFLNIENFNSKESEKILDLITKVITKEEINLSEFDSNSKSVVKKNKNFSVVVFQKNSFTKLNPPYSNIYYRFCDLFRQFRFLPFETLSYWITSLETTKQEEGLLNLLKKKKTELEEKILKRRLEKIFKNKTTDFGDKDFTEKKKENSEDSQNLYKILPRFRLYFNISKKESIEFLKNGGLENLKKQISQIIPNEDFQLTNLRIGSIDAEFAYKAKEVKKYLQKVASGEDTKEFEEKFKNLTQEFSKKTFKTFNNKELKASAQTFYLDKSKKDEVKQCLEKGSKCGLIKTIDMLVEEINKEALERETNIKKNVSNIEKAIDNMISSNNYNKDFKEELEKAKKDSIFEYVVDSLPIMFKDSQQYEKAKAQCPNCQTKILFHGTKAEPAAAIITSQFRTNDGFIGEGVYLSDMLDLVRCYSLRTTSTPKPGESFYVVGSEIFFDKNKARRVGETIQGQRKKTEKNGIHYGLAKNTWGDIMSDSEVESFKNKCVGREYMISFLEQINPIFGLKLKRNDYCIIWRDPNFNYNNEFREYIENLKKFIEEEVGCNLYIETSTESALRLVKKKKYNKIILVSNIGLDLGGKRFVEEARKIIGCNAYTLFSSYSDHHLNEGWLQNFENALFSNEREFSEEFLKDFSIGGLKNLKIKVEKHYKCKIKAFTDVHYVHYVENGNINGLNYEGFELYKHKFLPNPC